MSWSLLQVVATTAAVLVMSALAFVWWQLTYWRRRGVHYIPPTFLFGNVKDAFLGRRPFADVMHDIYRQASDEPFFGIYMLLQPSLVITDLRIIKDVLIRCALSNFQHHIGNPDPVKDPLLANNLFMVRGPKWKKLRSSISAAFSSGKMKMMYPLLLDKSKKLVDKLDEVASQPDPRVDMKSYTARFTTDVIATCGFGIETNALNNPDNKFFQMGLRVFERTVRHSLDTMIIFAFSSLVKLAGSVMIAKDVADFFRHIVWSVVKEREEKGIRRGDFLDLLIQLNHEGRVQEDDEGTAPPSHQVDTQGSPNYLVGDELVAQAVVFYIAGYETSSTTFNFTLLELARHPECQEKLAMEVDSALKAHGEDISYEALHSMPYLDKVINEALRKYPPLAMLDRYCTEEYRNPEFNLVIPKGTHVLVPVLGIHHDPRYYRDPEKFDPERFSAETKESRPNYTFMPFGEGPRICIGMRFAIMQMKSGLFHILSKFQFSLPEDLKGIKSLPLDIKSFLISPVEGLDLVITKRKKS